MCCIDKCNSNFIYFILIFNPFSNSPFSSLHSPSLLPLLLLSSHLFSSFSPSFLPLHLFFGSTGICCSCKGWGREFILKSPATGGLSRVVMKERLETRLPGTGGFTRTWAELCLRPSARETFDSKLELHCPPAFTAEKEEVSGNIRGKKEAPRLMPWMRNKRNTIIPVPAYLEEHRTELILPTGSRFCSQVDPEHTAWIVQTI